MAIELRAEDSSDLARHYYNRGMYKQANEDLIGACSDWEKASQLRDRDAKIELKEYCK